MTDLKPVAQMVKEAGMLGFICKTLSKTLDTQSSTICQLEVSLSGGSLRILTDTKINYLIQNTSSQKYILLQSDDLTR